MKRILYFGLDPSRYPEKVFHYPLIRTNPLPYDQVEPFFTLTHTHVLFTSRQAVTYFFNYTPMRDKIYLCIGEATAQRVEDFGVRASYIAEEAHGEGVIEMLKAIDYECILYPHSAKARPLLPNYLKERGISFILYETHSHAKTLPDLTLFDRIVFTSPSTVEVFAYLSKSLPPREKCQAIGPITQNALEKLFINTHCDSILLPE